MPIPAPVSQLANHLKLRFCQRFRSDERGVAAMEFAILAPLIIGIYLGLAEFGVALGTERKVSHSASVAGDLAAQVESLDEGQIEDLISAALHVADLKEYRRYGIRLRSYYRLANGNVRSEGQVFYRTGGHGGAPMIAGRDITEEMMPRGSGLIVASVRHRYVPFGFGSVNGDGSDEEFLPNSFDMEQIFMLKPRRSSKVTIGTPDTNITYECRGTADNVRCTES